MTGCLAFLTVLLVTVNGSSGFALNHHAGTKMLYDSVTLKPLQQAGHALYSWEKLKNVGLVAWETLKAGGTRVYAVTHSAAGGVCTGITDWWDDFNVRMMEGGERAAFIAVPWLRDPLLNDMVGSGVRQYSYSVGYTTGYAVEQIAVGALTAGGVKIAQVMAKGGVVLAGQLAKRTVAAVATRAHLMKRLLAEAVKLPDDILALFQQRLSMAGVGPTGEGMLKVPLEVLQEGAESARFNFKQYFESVFDSPKLNKFLRQGDAAAQKAANSLLLDRMAQMKTILGDEFTETLQKNFMKVVEDVILVRRPDENVESFFEAFLKAFEGNPSLMKHADELAIKVGGDLEPMSAEAKATLKKFLSDPNAGKLWEIDVPAIVDNEPAVPHNYWVRGILAELSIYKRVYKQAGYEHFPNAAAFDFKSAADYVQIKTLKNPDGAYNAMKKAVDALALLPGPPSGPQGLKLHILKKPGSGSDQMEVALREYIRDSQNDRVKQVQLIIQEFDLVP